MKNFNISYSWTQPYSVSMNPYYHVENRQSVDEILNRYDEIENIIQHMSHYPDAENLLANLKMSK